MERLSALSLPFPLSSEGEDGRLLGGVETQKERRQRTPAVVTLLPGGLSSNRPGCSGASLPSSRSEFDAGTLRNTDLMCGVTWGIPKGAVRPAVVVTAYRPENDKWSDDFKTRL